MMDLFSAISDLVTAGGVTGNETAAGEKVSELFKKFTDDVWRDTSGNVYARMGEGKPVILIMAHMDEIGMMVTDIEDNGMLRLCSVAGVDPRVLPGSKVKIFAKEPLTGVIGAVPPHLLTEEDSAYKIDDLTCDVGLPPEKVRSLVSVGDFIAFDPVPPIRLKNGMISSKTLDDRALVASLAECMEILSKRRLNCSVVFCASVQEESKSVGSVTGAWNIRPDIAVALDVTHGRSPGTEPFDTFDMEKLAIAKGGNIHPKLYNMLMRAAEETNIPAETDVCMGPTGTDAWYMQIQRGGIPTAIVSIPLRYMHTTVETLSEKTLRACAKLIASFAENFDSDWEGALCLDN
jgi:endoglucanase